MSDEQDRPAMLSDLMALKMGLKNELLSVIREEGETTRRHFDVVAERMSDNVKLAAELASHHSTVLDDHETRIQKIEQGR